MLDATNDEIGDETPASSAPRHGHHPDPDDHGRRRAGRGRCHVGPDPAGSVTVDPGTTVHVDTSTGVTTAVPHDGSEPTATDATGASVSVPPAAVAEAVAASADAGVTVPAAPPRGPAAPVPQPVI